MIGSTKYPVELRRRAVRMYRESVPEPVIRQMARQLGVHPEALVTSPCPGPDGSGAGLTKQVGESVDLSLIEIEEQPGSQKGEF